MYHQMLPLMHIPRAIQPSFAVLLCDCDAACIHACTMLAHPHAEASVPSPSLVCAGMHAGTLIAPPLAQASLPALCFSRVIVGLGEGFAPAAATNIMARLIPESERSSAVAYVFGGLDLGSVIGLLLCGHLIASFGWSSVFYVFAVLGLVWSAAWPLVRPEQRDPIMVQEAAILEKLEAERRGASSIAESSDTPVSPCAIPSVQLLPLLSACRIPYCH
jgi:MFS family permease